MYYTKSMKTYEKLYHYLSTHPDYVSGEALAQNLGISRSAIWKAVKTLEKKGVQIDSVKKRATALLRATCFCLKKLPKICIPL